MSIKQYDPQYETNVPHFNRKVVEQWVSENDLGKISHWLENGRPHQRLANEAVHFAIYKDNPNVIELVYNSEWVEKEKVLEYVLSKCETSIFPKKDGRDYFPNVREWSVIKTFNEIKSKGIKEKTIKELIFIISKTLSCDKAYNFGIDYSIKTVSEYVSNLSNYLKNEMAVLDKYYNREESKEQIQKHIVSCVSYLDAIVFLVKNKANVGDIFFRTLVMYSNRKGFEFIKPYIEEVLSADSVIINDHKKMGLLATELAVWKQSKEVDKETFINLVKLFIRSRLKEKLIIKKKEVIDEYPKKGELYDYFRVRNGVVGGIERNRSQRQNFRPNQNLFYNDYELFIKDKVIIDIREYIFINHDKGDSYNLIPVSKEEIQESIKKYESLKLKM